MRTFSLQIFVNFHKINLENFTIYKYSYLYFYMILAAGPITQPRPSMSVHKKCQPNRSSRLACYGQHIHIYTNVYYIDILKIYLPDRFSRVVVY